MLKSIRNRLILIYTASTGFILTAVLLFVMVITNQQLNRSKMEEFQTNYININHNVQMSNVISNLWLVEMETENHLIIHIEDNGDPFMYFGAFKVPTDRTVLINKIKTMAEKDGISSNSRPISRKEIQSPVYDIKGDKNDRYLGEFYIVPTDSGYCSVTVLQYIADNFITSLKQMILILLLDLVGIAAFFFLSRWIVGNTLKPVEESRKRQTEFIAAASHELKSPLAVIRANASALLIDRERAEHFSEGIDKECKRMSGLIEDMLLLASVDARNWQMRKEQIDLDKLFIETYDAFQPYCQEHRKDLKLEIPDELFTLAEGDYMRIRQVLTILLDNAITYTKEGDTIILRAYTKKSLVYIEVEDHGPGIDDSKKKEVFEKFFRVDKSRKDKNHYGLGLSIAKELVELHKGCITIKDTLGGGATFMVSLPILVLPDKRG